MLFCATGCIGVHTPESEYPMDIDVLDIGQADCIILTFEGLCVMIDAGEEDDGEDILEHLALKNISRIDLLILTHFDKDHIGGADHVLNGVEVSKVIMPDYERDSKQYRQLEEAVNSSSAEIVKTIEDMSFTVGTADFEIWASPIAYDAELENDNEMSLVTRIVYGEMAMLFLADAEGEWLDLIVNKNYNITCDLIKMPCHGAWDGFNSSLLLGFGFPRYAIITDSSKNPADVETISGLDVVGAKILRTSGGEIHLTCDGSDFTVD